jgi:hypothetical protein
MPACDFSKAIRQGFRSSTSRFFTRKKDTTIEELVDCEALDELMVRKSRRDYPVDSKALAAASNGSQWTMHSKEVATERFNEAYEVSVATYFLFSSITPDLFRRPLHMSYC